MSERALVTGVVFKNPVQKTSKSGRPYVFLTIRSGSGDAARWWKCFIFSESTIAEVMQLSDGESIAVSGEFDAEIYAPAGAESRITWKITADAVLSAKRLRPKEPRREQPARAGATKSEKRDSLPLLHQGGEINDDIPF